MTCSGISATFFHEKRSLSATHRPRHELQDTFRYGLAGDSGGQEPRANVGQKAVSKETAFFVGARAAGDNERHERGGVNAQRKSTGVLARQSPPCRNRLAIWSRAHNTGDFYIAGKGMSPVANGMATAADWMSAASFISMAGLIAFLGYDGSVYLMGWTGGYVLLALLLAPYLRKFGKFTVPPPERIQHMVEHIRVPRHFDEDHA